MTRWEQLDEDLDYLARRGRPLGHRPRSDPHHPDSLPRPARHRPVPRPHLGAEDPDLRQGRPPRRGDRAHRPRGVRQGQRLRQKITYRTEGDPQDVLTAFRNDDEPAHRRHRRHDRHRHRHEADRGADLHARRQVGDLLRADEGPRRPHHQRGRPAAGDPRHEGEDPFPPDRRRRCHRDPQGRQSAARAQAFGDASRADRARSPPATPRTTRWSRSPAGSPLLDAKLEPAQQAEAARLAGGSGPAGSPRRSTMPSTPTR